MKTESRIRVSRRRVFSPCPDRIPFGLQLVCASLIWLAFPANLVSQSAQIPAPVFRTTVPQVEVTAQVREGGKTIVGLEREDFIVLEDGQPKTVAYFGLESRPLDIVLLIDTNCWLERRAARIMPGLHKTVSLLQPSDRVAVMVFGKQTTNIADLTFDKAEIDHALTSLSSSPLFTGGGSTNVNGAVYDAARYLRLHARTDARRVILTPTFNAGRRHPPNSAVLEELWEADAVLDVAIMASIGHDQIFALPFEANLKSIAKQTGGEVVKRTLDPAVIGPMLERFRHSYVLQFTPSSGSIGSRRSIAVNLSPGARRAHPQATVTARRGYVLSVGMPVHAQDGPELQPNRRE